MTVPKSTVTIQRQVLSSSRRVRANIEGPATNGFAIASLVLGLVGLSVLAIVFGHISRSQVKRTGEGGWGLATAGLILGYVELLASVGSVVYVLTTSR